MIYRVKVGVVILKIRAVTATEAVKEAKKQAGNYPATVIGAEPC
jgi:hypothetical protein